MEERAAGCGPKGPLSALPGHSPGDSGAALGSAEVRGTPCQARQAPGAVGPKSPDLSLSVPRMNSIIYGAEIGRQASAIRCLAGLVSSLVPWRRRDGPVSGRNG